jgi:hypothetical protein
MSLLHRTQHRLRPRLSALRRTRQLRRPRMSPLRRTQRRRKPRARGLQPRMRRQGHALHRILPRTPPRALPRTKLTEPRCMPRIATGTFGSRARNSGAVRYEEIAAPNKLDPAAMAVSS